MALEFIVVKRASFHVIVGVLIMYILQGKYDYGEDVDRFDIGEEKVTLPMDTSIQASYCEERDGE